MRNRGSIHTMTGTNRPEIDELFDFLSAATLPDTAQPAVIFGRAEPLVARAAGDLIVPGLVTTAVITGGIGKDSGDIMQQGFKSEAEYLMWCLQEDSRDRSYMDTLPDVLLETKATNGGENARFSLAILRESSVTTSALTAVAHATSARRLAETLRLEASKINSSTPVINIKPSSYRFDPSNEKDVEEALAEFKRLMEWPKKGWLLPQELPDDLVDFVLDTGIETPAQPSRVVGDVLRKIPPKLRSMLFNKFK